MKTRAIVALLLLAACSESAETGTVTGFARLSGETDHRGIYVEIGEHHAVTDAEGHYRIDGVPAGSRAVRAHGAGALDDFVIAPVTVRAKETVSAPELVFTPAGDIVGKVEGLEQADRAVVTVAGTGLESWVSGSNGSFAFRLAAGHHKIVVFNPGRAALSAEVDVTRGETVQVPPFVFVPMEPTPSGELSGQVNVAGNPYIPYIHITVVLTGPVAAATVTNSAGMYTFKHLPPGRYAVTATVPQTVEESRSYEVDVTDGPVSAAPLDFTPVGELHGSVWVLNAACGGTLVTVDGLALAAVTEDDGSFTMSRVPLGTWVIRASRPGFRDATSEPLVVDWGKQFVNLEMSPESWPTFSEVTTGGTALLLGATDHAGTRVSIDGASTPPGSTDASGRFTVTGPGGFQTLIFENGPWQERVPNALLLDNQAFLFWNKRLQPLPTLSLPRASRIVSSDSVTGVTASPSGTHAVFSSSKKFQAVPLAGGPVVELGGEVKVPVRFAAGGTRVVFVEEPSCTVRSALLDGSEAPVTLGEGACGGVELDPDGERAFFVGTVAGARALVSVPVAGGAATTLVSPADLFVAQLSPDGNTLVLTVKEASDGTSKLFAVPRGGAAPVLLSQLGAGWQWNSLPAHRFSRDGQRILFRAGGPGSGELHIANANGTERKLLGTASGNNFVFTQDDGLVVFVKRTLVLAVVPAAGGDARDLMPAASVFAAARLADGQTLLVSYKDPSAYQSSSLERVRLDGTGRQLLRAPADKLWIAPDGLHALTQGFGDLLWIDGPGAAATVLTREATQLTFFADGVRFAYVTRSDGSLYVGSLLDGATRVVATGIADSLMLAADESHFIYRTSSMQLESVRVDGDAHMVLTESGEKAKTFAFSPDGARVAYLNDRSLIRIVGIEGGAPATILEGVQTLPTWGDATTLLGVRSGYPTPGLEFQLGLYVSRFGP